MKKLSNDRLAKLDGGLSGWFVCGVAIGASWFVAPGAGALLVGGVCYIALGEAEVS